MTMRTAIVLGAALGVLLASGATDEAAASGKRRPATAPAMADAGGAHPKSSYYRGPRVRGFVQRRGGYSFFYPDTINTYGGFRTIYGSGLTPDHPQYQRQGGPFDHGFFFDSGIAGRGSESVYAH